MSTSKNMLTIVFLAAITAGIIFFYAWEDKGVEEVIPPVTTPQEEELEKQPEFDPKNASYEIDGKTATLVNGISEIEAAPGSASKITTRYFGNEAYGDLNGDGLSDMAFLITQDGGGTGLFYYAVVAFRTTDGYKTTNAFLIGDRIAPQTTEIKSDSLELRVNYAERKPGEPMTAEPSVGATKYLKVTPEGTLTGLMQ